MRRVLQTFKDHMIDGETLPLLSEEHLLDTLGLKLGPALKIRSQVHRPSEGGGVQIPVCVSVKTLIV